MISLNYLHENTAKICKYAKISENHGLFKVVGTSELTQMSLRGVGSINTCHLISPQGVKTWSKQVQKLWPRSSVVPRGLNLLD